MSQVKKHRLIVLGLLLVIVWCTSAGVRNLILWRRIDATALARIPLIRQGAYKESVAVIGGVSRSVSTSGCGAACIAMASGYLHGRNAPSPVDLFRWTYENDYYTGDGLTHAAMTALAKHEGLSSEWIGVDAAHIRASLWRGLPVIAHMGPGTFTRNGHYILLRGLDHQDNTLVNDPGSAKRTEKSYPLTQILSQLRTSQSIMILWV